MGLPSASTVAWILVLNPPRLRPRACFCGSPFCTSAVLVGAHDGRIDHRVLVVRILRQGLEHPLPYAAATPARVARMHDAEIAKALGQIPPRDACAVAVQHRVREQPVVLCSGSGLPALAGQ